MRAFQLIVLLPLLVCGATDSCRSQDAVASQAVLRLSFDDAANPLLDSAAAGAADAATLPNNPRILTSPFWNRSSGSAVYLTPNAMQRIEIADSVDLDCETAVSVSLLFVSLDEPSDATYHGLFGKRTEPAPNTTNYGINFAHAGDTLQVYVNSGAGFKVAQYSTAAVCAPRRRTHITATYEKADAPGADVDTDADDLRIRLFVNGKPLVPKAVPDGIIDGQNAWFPDLDLAACLNDVPLTFGSSFGEGEPAAGVYDELLVFRSALNDQQAMDLFREICGDNAEALAQQESSTQQRPDLRPVISSVSLRGVQIGATTAVDITGSRLEDAMAHLDVPGAAVSLETLHNPGHATFQVTVPANTVPGRYPLRVATKHGVSEAISISVDALPQQPVANAINPENPLALPVAVSGILGGSQQIEVYFTAGKGQRLVAEIEARRLGANFDPVIELNSPGGSPLSIAWQQPQLFGDARAVQTLPEDGTYVVRIHDLQYKAPGNSAWRLLLGDLLTIDGLLPQSGDNADLTAMRVVGQNPQADTSITVSTAGRDARLESVPMSVPLPSLPPHDGREYAEPVTGWTAEQPLDAQFSDVTQLVYANGVISAAKEKDVITLTVQPGQTLRFELQARLIGSSLRGNLVVRNGNAQLAVDNGQAGRSDAAVTVTVPDGVTQLSAEVSDFTQRGGNSAIYRLLVAKPDRPAFRIAIAETRVELPENGSIPLEVSIIRKGSTFQYLGPIQLRVEPSSGLTILPETIPAENADSRHLLLLTRTRADVDPLRNISIVGTGSSGDSTISATASINLTSTGRLLQPADSLPVGTSAAVASVVVLDGPPPVLLRGVPAELPVRLLALNAASRQFMRFTLQTTEAKRPSDPKNANSPPLPMVRSDLSFVPPDAEHTVLTLQVPNDVVESSIDAIVVAEAAQHPFALADGPAIYSAPMQLAVDNALTVTAPTEPILLKPNETAKLVGSLTRHPLFDQAVNIQLTGLPGGVTAPNVAVAADQSEFTIEFTANAEAPAGESAGIKLQVLGTDGTRLVPELELKLKGS